MDSTSATQPFVPLFDSVPSTRHPAGATLSASIWAPQPLPSDTAWSRAIDSISRVNDDLKIDTSFRPEMRRACSHPAGKNNDVFGPVGLVSQRRKDVGAIGDGRRKINDEYEAHHVEQLLRTLNLNSPAPFASAQVDGALVSPVSTTSGLDTPPDISPAKAFGEWKVNPSYDCAPVYQTQPHNALHFETDHAFRYPDMPSVSQTSLYHPSHSTDSLHLSAKAYSCDSFSEEGIVSGTFAHMEYPVAQRRDSVPSNPFAAPWSRQRLRSSSAEWLKPDERRLAEHSGFATSSDLMRGGASHASAHEPINFLSLLHPSSAPPYHLFVSRIIKSSDQQASIFLQQKLKVADADERGKIVDAICARGFEMMAHRFGNWAVQRCLEATSSPEERRKIVLCMKGKVVDLATNCYGCHVLQKALDCEEDIRLLIVSELLLGDPAQTLVNKHASHVWSKIMELSWTPPAPPIFAFVNKSLKGKWAALACHETGSLVVQHAFENLEDAAKDGIIDELLGQGPIVFGEVAKSQWGSYCVQHILEHGSAQHRSMALEHLTSGLLEYATHEQGSKSVTKALKEGGKETLDRIIKRMCEPAKGGRRATIVDLALSVTGSQLIASVLPNADKDQRALLYESIRGHIVTLRGCKTGSKVIWLFDRMRAYYGY